MSDQTRHSGDPRIGLVTVPSAVRAFDEKSLEVQSVRLNA